MAEQAYAYVTLIPVAKGFQGAIAKEMAGVSNVGQQAGEGAGNRFTQGFGSVMKGLAVAGAVAVGVAATGIGIAMNKGFSRLQNIENARNLLQGIGHDAQTVEKVMDNALESVLGTAFGLDEAAKVAAGAVAAGIEPGEALERQLKIIADTAVVAGSSMEDIGAIMGKVTTSNRATNRELQQLAERGIPVYQMLADEAGVSADAIFDMASRGEISSEMLANALETNLGGAALKAGETTAGAFANLQASFGRIGANLLGPLFDQLAPFLSDLTEAFKPVEAIASELGATLGEAMVPVFESLVDLVPTLVEAFTPLIPVLMDIGVALIESVVQILPTLIGFVGSLIPIVEALLPPFLDLLPILLDLIEAVLPIFADLMSELAPIIAELAPIIVELISTALDVIVPIFLELARALMPLVEQLLPIVADLFMEIAPAVMGLIESLGPLIDAILPILIDWWNILIPIIVWLADLLGDVLVFAINLLVDGLTWLVDMFSWLVSGVSNAGETVENIWNGVVDFFSAIPEKIMGFFTGATDFLKNIGGNIMEGMGEGASRAWEAVSGWFGGVKDRVTNAVGAAHNWLQEAGATVMEGMEAGASGAWDNVKNWFGNTRDRVVDATGVARDWLTKTGEQIMEGMESGTTTAWQNVRNWFGGLRDRVDESSGGRALEWLREKGEQVMSGFGDGNLFSWETVSNWFGERKNTILEIMKDPLGWLKQTGENIINGLLEGLKSAWTAVADWVRRQVQWIKDQFASALKIQSPSQVFFEFGEAIGEGLLLGMQKMQPEIESQVDMMINVPNAERAVDAQASGRTMNYYAAPNQSLSGEQELMKAMRRARLVANW